MLHTYVVILPCAYSNRCNLFLFLCDCFLKFNAYVGSCSIVSLGSFALDLV